MAIRRRFFLCAAVLGAFLSPRASWAEAGSAPSSSLRVSTTSADLAPEDDPVASTYAFPVPWRPNSQDPQRYGLPFGQSQGAIVGGISFVNLPLQGELRIYTLTGEQIIAVPMNGSIKWTWDGKNSAGSDVVSGTYLWLIDSNGSKKTGKLMIIR